ncbi:hypothetical protein H8959_000478 [Pygathrix nigripes]
MHNKGGDTVPYNLQPSTWNVPSIWASKATLLSENGSPRVEKGVSALPQRVEAGRGLAAQCGRCLEKGIHVEKGPRLNGAG